ncbi:hypothetical protein Tco_1281659, partial [Tanacetum coccineum]
ELTNKDIRNSESYKEYYAIALGKIPPKTKASKKKADTDATTKQKLPTIPKEKKEKKSGKGKQKAKELETISEAILTEAEQLKIITKRSRKETHISHTSRSGADEGTGVSPGVPDAPDYDSDDVISWRSSEDDQADDKNENDENAQDDEDDDKYIDGDETIHEEETDEDDSFDPIVHTPSHVSSSDDEGSDNDVEGLDAEGEKSDEDARDVEDQGNEADKDKNTNLEGRDEVMTDVLLPQAQATLEIKDTHVTLTLVNPDGQQQSSSVSSGFVSNMLNPNQDTGVDAIFGQQISSKPPIVPKEKKSGKGKQKAKQLETISKEMMTEAEQLKTITKRSRKETHNSHASGSGADEGTGVSPGGDETIHEEETDEDDSFDPIVHTPSHVSSSDDEGSDNDVEGLDAEGEKSDEDARDVEDQELRRTKIKIYPSLKEDMSYIGQQAEATSLIEIPITTIAKPSSSISSIPGIVDQYLANKMQEAVDVAV